MKDPGGVLNGLEQADENWFSDDGYNQVCNASDDASIQSSPFSSSYNKKLNTTLLST